jgi:hypothetical protein
MFRKTVLRVKVLATGVKISSINYKIYANALASFIIFQFYLVKMINS